MSLVVRTFDAAGLRLAVVRRCARPDELSRVVPEACGLVWRTLQRHGLRGGRHVALYWDGPAQLEVGVELERAFDPQEGLALSGTPPGPVAATTHLGPYATLSRAHQAIRAWSRLNGRDLAGPYWEIYSHWRAEWDADPSQITTEVVYRLR